jgi:hypothetical protein
MMRIAKGLAWAIGALLIVLLASFAWGRLRPPTAAQAQAMALLKPVPPLAGASNAWATLWLLDYDVPADQVDAVYAKEREALLDWARQLPQEGAPTTSYTKAVAQHFPELPEFAVADREKLCRLQDPDCLDKVRANVQSLRELLARQSVRVTRLRAIPVDAIVWDDTTTTPYTPYPDLGAFESLQLTAAALDFVDGQQAQALAQVCRNARTVRHLHAHTNTLVGAMVADSWMDPIERLLAGMLSELPADQSIPADCAAAFAPVTRADVNMCAPMEREYEFVQLGMANVDPAKYGGRLRYFMRLMVDTQGMHRLIAPTYAWACQPTVIDSMLGDHPLNSAQWPGVQYDIFDTVSNAMGLILARVAKPDYAGYLNRNEDYAAGLRAMGWLLATRATATTADDWRRQLATARPALQQGGHRDFQLDSAGKRLIMPCTETRPHHHELVLPLTK